MAHMHEIGGEAGAARGTSTPTTQAAKVRSGLDSITNRLHQDETMIVFMSNNGESLMTPLRFLQYILPYSPHPHFFSHRCDSD